MTGGPTTPSPDSVPPSASQVFKSKSSATGSKNKTGLTHGENYLLIKTPDEGGHKRMLDVVFEKLRYTIESEWTEGQVVAEILESYEDVNVETPRRLTAAEKNDDLLVEIWKEEVKQHVTEVKALNRAKKKLFATVWKLLTKAMRNKVSAQEDFEERNTAGDAVWLVNVIRAIVTEFDSTVPEILSTLDSLTKILTFQQSEKMENADYVKGLMALIKVHEQHCGPFGVSTKDMKRLYDRCDTAVDEQGQPLDADSKSRLRTKEAKVLREKAIAMQIIRGACKRRYSALKKNLAMDYGLKINKYPDTVEDAINALNVQENNLPSHLRKGKNQNGFTLVQEGNEGCVAGRNGRVIEHIQCHRCKAKGHYANQCPSSEEEGGDSSKALDGQVSTHVLNQLHETSDGSPSNHIQLTTSLGTIDQALILLDSGSTVHVFNNKELLTDIRPHPDGRVLTVYTNGGSMDSRMVGRFGNITVWYNPRSIANILSLSLLLDSCTVLLDSRVGHAFNVWWDNKSYIKFVKSHGLFLFNSITDKIHKQDLAPDGQVSCLQTVDANERNYRRREIESARAARDISKLLFHPAQSTFERIVKGNFIQNLPVTLADVRRADKIYGPSIPSLKGRTTRQQPSSIQDIPPVGIPRALFEEYQFVTLCLDFFYVNKLPVFHAISRKINHRWISFPNSRSRKDLQKVFDELRRIYHSRGFRITTAHADEEFEKLRNHMLPCRLVCPEPGGHVPEVERSIRTIKEGCRAAIHGMPYRFFPKEMLRGLIRKVILMLNAFPGSHGVSDTLSPRNIVENLPHLDYHSLKIPFGAYVQVAVDEMITNTPRPRTVGCIVLDPVGINQKYRFMSLESGRRVSGRMVRELPITEEVIARVNELGATQKQPEVHDGRLLFEWRPGLPVDDDLDLLVDHLNEHDEEALVIPEPVDEEEDVINDDIDNIVPNQVSETETTESEEDFPPPPNDSISVEDESEREQLEEDSDSLVKEDFLKNDFSNGPSMSDEEIESDSSIGSELSYEESDVSDDPSSESINEIDQVETQSMSDEPLGRGMRGRQPNSRYYNEDFQFLQTDFKDLSQESRADFLTCAMDEFRVSKKTHLLERYLTGVILLQMSASAGLRKHGKEAEKALLKEFQQFKGMDVMDVLDPDLLTQQQKEEALGMVNILQEKRDHTPENPHLKIRGCANGKKQRQRYTREETTSPTSGVDSILLTLMIAAMEGRDVAVADIVGAYLHAEMDDFVAMKIVGREAELMCELYPEWKVHLRYDKRKKAILYVRLKKALYGCVKSALLWYELYSTTLKELGFVLNPYDQCVANATINGSQCTICWYVDDNLITHVDPSVVSAVIHDIEKKFGKMSVTRGKEHEFLGMKIKLHQNKTVSIDMKDYVKSAIDSFSEDITKNASTPATRYLFDVRDESPLLPRKRAENFHSVVAKLLYISKRCRLDIQNAVAFLTTRVSKPDEDDWRKLKRVLQYLRGTIDDKLILGCIDIGKVKSFVDAAFAVHPDMRSHTGGGISLGIGIILSMCQKQKLNTKSSTEAEIVGVSDFLPNLIWARMFLEHQGYEIDENLLYQDNQSAIKIEKNGSKSCSKRSRHIDMRYFFIKDRLESEEIEVVFCPTEHMVADFFTKPLQGKLFQNLKAIIMGHEPISTLTSRFSAKAQERVGSNVKDNTPEVSSRLKPIPQQELNVSRQGEVEQGRFTKQLSRGSEKEENRWTYADIVKHGFRPSH